MQYIVRQFWEEPADYPLWFVRDLICVSLIAPILHYFIRYTQLWGVFLLLTLYTFNIQTHITGLSTSAIAFFSLGIYLSINQKNIISICNQYGKTSSLIWLLILLVWVFHSEYEWSEYLHRLSATWGIFGYFFLFRWIFIHNPRFFNWMNLLAPSIFFVYASHLIHIQGIGKGFFSRPPLFQADGWQFIPYILVPTYTIMVCLSLYYTMKRFTPRLLNVLIGNR